VVIAAEKPSMFQEETLERDVRSVEEVRPMLDVRFGLFFRRHDQHRIVNQNFLNDECFPIGVRSPMINSKSYSNCVASNEREITQKTNQSIGIISLPDRVSKDELD